MNQKKRIVVGIDFGTTNSAIAYVNEHHEPELIHNARGESLTPTVVYFPEDDNPVIGTSAREAKNAEPDRVVEFIKRQMGAEHYMFPIIIDGEEEHLSPEEIAALVFNKMVRDAKESLGGMVEIRDAVITVPADFDNFRRERIKRAGELAGLNVVRLLNEPTAAAVAFGYSKRHTARRVMVYDLGGGTFDVTVLERSGVELSNLQVVASDGDPQLGGKDFDDCIIKHFLTRFRSETGLEIDIESREYAGLRERAERLKKQLTERKNATEFISYQGKSVTVKLSREEFEGMITGYVERTVMLCSDCLNDAGLTWDDIDTVLLVGGSTRIPQVRQQLGEVSGCTPSRVLNPDEAVALGAAYVGWQLSAGVSRGPAGEDLLIAPPKSDEQIKLTDVTPCSLGMIMLNRDRRRINRIFLNKNTPLPAEFRKVYKPARDYVDRIRLAITEGESDDPDLVRVVAAFTLQLPEKRPRDQSRIEVSYRYDRDGIVNISATDLASGSRIAENVTPASLKAPRPVSSKLDDLMA